jgi:O-6-methylguanine DNA methyltransferase
MLSAREGRAERRINMWEAQPMHTNAEALALGLVTTWAGTTRVLATAAGVREVHLPRVPAGVRDFERTGGAEIAIEHVTSAKAEEHLQAALEELAEFFAGRRQVFTVLLDVRGSEFFHNVWRTVAAIPYGETRTYLEIAREMGMPQAPRAIGAANAANPAAPFVPCHRVPASDGQLRGYGPGLPLKRTLLVMEDAMPADETDYAPWVERVTRRLRAEGHAQWYLGLRGLGVYCLPDCSRGGARRLQPNRLLRTHEEAQQAGFRPCSACGS